MALTGLALLAGGIVILAGGRTTYAHQAEGPLHKRSVELHL